MKILSVRDAASHERRFQWLNVGTVAYNSGFYVNFWRSETGCCNAP